MMKQKQIRSRIKEFISDEVMELIYKVYRKRNVSNNEKAAAIESILDHHNVENTLLGPGTNRVAFLIDGYVFKFAMDSWGVKDNYNELANSKELQPYVVKTYETCGLINVCEYVTLISADEFERGDVKNVILETLSILSSSYLLGDVGYTPKNFTNWGFRDNLELVILDYAYLYQIENQDILCRDDGEVLEYNENFTSLVCPSCRRKYSFMDIRRPISTSFEANSANEVLQSAYRMKEKSMYVPDEDYVDENAEYAVKKSDIIKDDVEAPVQQENLSEAEYLKKLGYDVETEEDVAMDSYMKLLSMAKGEPEPEVIEEEPEETIQVNVSLDDVVEEVEEQEEPVVQQSNEIELPQMSFEIETDEKDSSNDTGIVMDFGSTGDEEPPVTAIIVNTDLVDDEVPKGQMTFVDLAEEPKVVIESETKPATTKYEELAEQFGYGDDDTFEPIKPSKKME